MLIFTQKDCYLFAFLAIVKFIIINIIIIIIFMVLNWK